MLLHRERLVAIDLVRLGRRLFRIDPRNFGQPFIEGIGVHIDGGAQPLRREAIGCVQEFQGFVLLL